MSHFFKKGPISNLQSVSGHTTYVWNFRVDNMPIILSSKVPTNFQEGDIISVAGEMKTNGNFGYCFYNETTGASFYFGTKRFIYTGIFLIVIGLPLILLLGLGLVFIGFGIYQIIIGKKIEKANEMLKSNLSKK